MGKILETARYWHRLGIAVIPIAYKLKQPKVKWLEYTEWIPTEAELNAWFASDIVNIGVVAGWKNLTIIDFDDMDVFLNWYQWADRRGGKAREVARKSRIHKSARGAHVFVLCENADNMKLPKIDVLAQRKYALLPPSLHPSGVNYTVYREAFPMPVHSLYDVLPKKLIDQALAQKAPKAVNASNIPSGDPVVDTADYDPWKEAGKSEDDQKLVERIKQKITIPDILSGWEDSGGNGRWKMTRCPFHDDKNPSFWLDTHYQVCGCHAGCTPLPLDVIDLYARLHNMTNFDAIKDLAQRI